MTKNLTLLALFSAATLLAQRPFPGRPGPKMPIGPAMGRTISGAPYSAVEVRESTQTLPNGNVISRKTQTNVYRDGMGRTRTETTVETRGRGAQAGQTSRTMVTIHDPVAGVIRELNPQTKTGHEISIPRRGGFGGRGANRDAVVRGRGNGQAPAGTASNPNVVTENLPMQTINGVQATGVRTTRTIPAGKIGNTQAIQIVHEVWMSPDLKVPVMTKTSDPRARTSTLQLTNITRSEPDPALFQAPSDYTVTKLGRGRGAAR